MTDASSIDIIRRIETPGLEVQTVSIPANSASDDRKITKQQLSSALRAWGRGDERFIPSFVDSAIVEEFDNVVVKEILHYGKSSMADGSPNLQRTTFRGDNLIVTEYLAGPWFLVIAAIEERQNGDICLLLTTLRHKQHPDYARPEQTVARFGADKAPLTTEQNARRVLGIIRELAENQAL